MSRADPLARLLIVGGHDPSGGAGLIADALVARQWNCHPLTVPTLLTVQDGRRLHETRPTDHEWLDRSIAALRADFTIAAIKIGALGALDNARVIARHAAALAVPVVWDPVLDASQGGNLTPADALRDAVTVLAPHCSVITPNATELATLAGADTPARARALLTAGAQAVLLTGGDDAPDDVVRDQLYTTASMREFSHARLPGRFRGSGCTLATALACALGRSEPLQAAVQQAREYTLRALRDAWPHRDGVHFPARG